MSTKAAGLVFFVTAALAVAAGLVILHASDRSAYWVKVDGHKITLTAQEKLGHEVFAQHCAVCHQLAASNSTGPVGPDLDSVQPSAADVKSIVSNGLLASGGDMPYGLATGPDLEAVALYVSRVADRKAYTP